MTQLTDTSAEYKDLCAQPKVQKFIREKMGLVEVDVWTKSNKGMVVVVSKISMQALTDDKERIPRRLWFDFDKIIPYPNLGQLVRWVPEGWKGCVVPDHHKDNLWLGFVEKKETFTQFCREAPTPEQAMLLALVAIEEVGG